MIHNNPDISNALKNNNEPISRPYMGNFTSAEIGNMARTGMLGGEVNRRERDQELKMMNDDPQKFF